MAAVPTPGFGHPPPGDRALDEAGIDRDDVYVTNAVKHRGGGGALSRARRETTGWSSDSDLGIGLVTSLRLLQAPHRVAEERAEHS